MTSNGLDMLCRRTWMFVTAALFLVNPVACSRHSFVYNQVDIQKAGQLQTGTSIIDVQSALGSKGGFGFLTRTERGEQLGLEFRVGSWRAPMFFIFEDSELKSVVPVPRKVVGLKVRKSQHPDSKLIPENPNTVLERILRAKSYLGQRTIDYAYERKPSGKPHVPNNLLLGH